MSATACAGTVDLYFDLASPYAYFAHGRLAELCARHGLRLRRRPVLLWAVLKELGMPTPMEHPAKRDYLWRDMARSAAYHGLPFRPHERFPVSSHAAARVYYAIEAGAAGLCEGYTEGVFRACFAQARDISDPGVIAAVAATLGLGEDWVRQAAAAESGKAALRQANAEAAARGVWGSPWWFWEGEAFFGADRLPQFERLLSLAPGLAAPGGDG